MARTLFYFYLYAFLCSHSIQCSLAGIVFPKRHCSRIPVKCIIHILLFVPAFNIYTLRTDCITKCTRMEPTCRPLQSVSQSFESDNVIIKELDEEKTETESVRLLVGRWQT